MRRRDKDEDDDNMKVKYEGKKYEGKKDERRGICKHEGNGNTLT